MRLWATIALTLVSSAAVTGAALADDCLRNQGHVLRILPGSDASDLVKFNFESRRESFSKSSFKYVWCIEADRQNLNIAEFQWGDAKDKCKYLCTLIEPGRGGVASKFDGSKKTEEDRTIGYSRKNRDDWRVLDTKTISSQKLGAADPKSASPLFIQIQEREPEWSQYLNEEGLVQIDRLSNNFGDFIQFLKQESGPVVSGGALTVTLPASSSVAKALVANEYDKYSPSDFVRATTSFNSTIAVDKVGSPVLVYWAGITPDKETNQRAFSSLISENQIAIKITSDIKSFPFPTNETIRLKEEGIRAIGSVQPVKSISYAQTKIQVAVSGLVVGTFDVLLFALKQ
jgi:hypothetical protein